MAALTTGLKGPIRVLDPACGDGNLLCAINEALPREMQRRVTLIGIENDDASFASLQARQQQFSGCLTDLIKGDFLEFFGGNDLFGSHAGLEPVDCIIANPPYVRTQVLGAKRAQQLATRFGLSGRVDLYQAFLVAMARQLRPGGVLDVITSNRPRLSEQTLFAAPPPPDAVHQRISAARPRFRASAANRQACAAAGAGTASQ